MAEEKSGVPTWMAVVTIAAPILSAIAVAVLTQKTNVHLAELDNVAKATQVAIEQAKLREQQEVRRQQFLVDHLPKLLSANATDRSIGRALFFLTYPSDASDIVQQLIPVTSDIVRQSLEDVRRQATEVKNETGEWAVIVSGDKTFEPAKYEVDRASKLGYKPVSLYLREGFYRTAVGSYPNRQVAEQAALSIRSQIRSDAYVVALGRWCTNSGIRTESGISVSVCSPSK